MKTTWAKINDRLGKTKNTMIANLIDHHGNPVLVEKDKANLLNSYFGSVFTQSACPVTDNLNESGICKQIRTSSAILGGLSFSVDQVYKALINCKSSSFSPDGVPSKLLKLAPELYCDLFVFDIFQII